MLPSIKMSKQFKSRLWKRTFPDSISWYFAIFLLLLLSFFRSSYFSPRRVCSGVLKFCMGFYHERRKKKLRRGGNLGPPIFFRFVKTLAPKISADVNGRLSRVSFWADTGAMTPIGACGIFYIFFFIFYASV